MAPPYDHRFCCHGYLRPQQPLGNVALLPYQTRDEIGRSILYSPRRAQQTHALAFPITLSIKGKRARDQLFEVFETYFANFANHSDQEPRDRPSELIEARVQVGKQHNISSQDTARFEVHTLLQILVNPVQTCFWLLLHVFSDKDLLEPIRTDLMSSVYYQSSKIDRLYVNRLRSNAPLLFSPYQETVRFIWLWHSYAPC